MLTDVLFLLYRCRHDLFRFSKPQCVDIITNILMKNLNLRMLKVYYACLAVCIGIQTFTIA